MDAGPRIIVEVDDQPRRPDPLQPTAQSTTIDG
jgi:hypothetical protein